MTGLARQPFAGFAPDDAFQDGKGFPYYGSEEPWDRRFFFDEALYGRRGQRQMLDIVEGRFEEAARYARQLLAADPGDLESWFNLAVAQVQMGQLDAAMEAVEQAVEKGLPFERFVAGPRDLLGPLTRSPAFRKFASGHPVQLLHGPMVGSVSVHSARFWVRTAEEVPVQVIASESGEFSNVLTSEVRSTSAAQDYTAVVEIGGLRPATRYFYKVVLDEREVIERADLQFQTFPPAGQGARFRIGFGGCAGFMPENERVWDVIAGHDPLAFLFLGDNVYIDLPGMPNGLHDYSYYQRQARPEFRRLVASTPAFAIWDDHDAAIDDVWLGPFRDNPAWKLPMLKVFRQNWNNPAYGDPEWPATWFSFSIGDVDFFMLDGRFYRTNPFAPDPTMLGPVQKRWLLEQLQRSTATFKVLVSPVVWAFAAKGDAKDTWNGYREERREIFDFLAEHRIDGVFLLSGDRHRSEAWRIDRPNGYPLYEFESSRLTNQHVHELVPGALFGYNEKQSFGLLTFDTTLPDPKVTYEIRSIDDELVHSLSVTRSEISHRR